MPRIAGSHIMPIEDRFMRHVYADPNTGCWLWGGANDGDSGYGRFRGSEIGEKQAHRASYRLFKGEIPDGYEIDHKVCNFPPCVNPAHLEAVTRKVNMQRSSKIGLTFGGPANGRRQQAKTHCPHGHSYEDAIIRKEGWRKCRTCFYAKEKARRIRRNSTGIV